MQPRCKADAPETSYPGIWGKLAPMGEGRTVALKGVVVSDIYYAKATQILFGIWEENVQNTLTFPDITILF